MAVATPTAGIEALVGCLVEQRQLRGTGMIQVGEAGCVYVVFGHPLHAVAGELMGPAAVTGLGQHAAGTGCAVTWVPGATAGRAHSLAPGDATLERLQALAGIPADPMWAIVINSICASLEADLHRHSAPFTAVIRGADPRPAALLDAIAHARGLVVRAVSRGRVLALLDDAEVLVRERAAG